MTQLTVPTPTSLSTQTPWFDAVVNFFKVNGWTVSRHETETALQMTYQGESAKWLCTAKTREELRQFVFHSACPILVPEEKRLAIAEFLTRANYGLIVGNFEMDFRDGEVRYKTATTDVDSNLISSVLIGHLVYVNVMTMDRYLPGIMALIYSDRSPDEVIQQIEDAFVN